METQINQRRGLLILLFFTFFMVVGFDMIMPLVIGHYVNNVGLTATAVSVALAIRQFSQQGLAMIGGALADRFQVKTLISVGVFLRVLGFLTLAFSSAYGMLIAAMILIGLGGVLFEMPYQSAIAMLTTNAKQLSPHDCVVCIISDGGDRYIQTLLDDAWMQSNNFSIETSLEKLLALTGTIAPWSVHPDQNANYKPELKSQLCVPASTQTINENIDEIDESASRISFID